MASRLSLSIEQYLLLLRPEPPSELDNMDVEDLSVDPAATLKSGASGMAAGEAPSVCN